MRKHLLMLLAPVLLTGCPVPLTMPGMSVSSGSSSPQVGTVTNVDLAAKNYKIVKTGATGSSWGFKLLGLITLKPVSYTKAITELYQDLGISEGKAHALANVVQQESSPFFILFSIPRITLHADLVEFMDEPLLEDEEDEIDSFSEAEEQTLNGEIE